MAKQYGLILPGRNNKPTPTFKASHNVFGEDSNSDEDKEKKQPMLRPSVKIRKQDKLLQEKALNEDPTVFQYDELYEDMEFKKKEEKSASKVEKKPKYIEKLMDSANKRKRENERRMERQVQKEREKEGDEFADKESFVTNAYKQKLDELRAEEEKEKREEYLEKIGDVTKQQDLGGFYRHLYEQKLGKEDKNDKSKDEIVKKEEIKISPKKDDKKQRNYRKRKSSNELLDQNLSDGEIVSEEETKLSLNDIKASKKARENKVNEDADSDFETESSDSEDDRENKNMDKKIKDNTKSNKDGADKSHKQKISEPSTKEEKREFKPPAPKETPRQGSDVSKSDTENKDNAKENIPSKPKINIWEKRTVGVVFEEALKRYYERKAARSH